MPRVFRHTVDVWVTVVDGKIVEVVGDDENLSEPLGVVYTPERGWNDKDVQPLTEQDRADYDAAKTNGAWPAWQWGW